MHGENLQLTEYQT